ncbi:MAG: FtsH protease activity modulator HflK [Bryobacteraceae bacterium]|jgi:Cu+-exporting ATPase
MHVHLPKEPVYDERKQLIQQFGFAAFIGILLLLNVTGIFTNIAGIDTAAILTLIAGYRTFFTAISGLLQRKISADLAICVAVIAALISGQFLAAAEAMFIMLIGEALEGYAAGRTHAAIQRFVEQLPRHARVIRNGAEVEVDAAQVVPGDLVVVRPGERLPADGVIFHGASSIDESTITGEPLPRDKSAGDEVFSGTLNGLGPLRITVTRAGAETTLSQVIKLVEHAREKRAPVERLADRFARYFLPALLLVAGLTFYFTRDWLRTVSVLIVACPCALILATPAAMVAAIGGLARRGILVRGGTVLQAAAKVDTVFFDKTGTVTEGRFGVIKVTGIGRSEAEVLALAGAAEYGSEHVLARAILDEGRRRGLSITPPDEARIVPGRGATARVGSRTIVAGNAAFLAEHKISGLEPLLEEADRYGATAVLVAENGVLAGNLLLRDRVREGARRAVHTLEHLEITHLTMLTGDRKQAAEAIAREVGLHDVVAGLLPEEKLERIRHAAAHGHHVAMVGDGLNDAPALAAAQVGIAVGGANDITAEAAGVVFLGHSLEALPKLFEVSRRALRTAWQNIIIFAGVVNAVAITAAATGKLGPIGAAVTHQVASLLVVLNSLRLLRVERHSGRLVQISAAWRHDLAHRLHHLSHDLDPKLWFDRAVAHRHELARPVLAVAVVLILLSGFYSLGPNETGVIERFGQKILPYGQPGLHYKLPWPIERLTRVRSRNVRVVEVGFRSNAANGETEPAAYEWNVQHRSGRFLRKPEESLMLTGDQNMVEVNAVVHYQMARPDDFLFQQLDAETTVRTAAESALQTTVSTAPLDDVLTTGRQVIEARVMAALQKKLDRYGAGVNVVRVKLLDVHPSLEVVDAFREVSAAFEEKNRLINEAEGYRNEQVALARGNAEARLKAAQGYKASRTDRAAGDGSRFDLAEAAFNTAPAIHRFRLYLETMEQVLPGKKKLILDSSTGRRHLLLLEDGVEVAPPGTLGLGQ